MPLGALPQRGLVVDATGVSARAMAGDPSVHPVRGQVVVVENPGLTEWWCDEDEADGPLYALPRGDHVVVGGTADDGELGHHARSGCGATDPGAGTRRSSRGSRRAAVLRHRVGLRPARPQVRLETVVEPEAGRAVVHCYGHGGAGITLSWGCADDVLAELSALA